MTITLTQANAVVSHTLGGSPTGITLAGISNDAGVELMNLRAWAWATAVDGTADFVQDQDYADLPSAFLRFSSTPRLSSGTLTPINMVSIARIETLRAGVDGGGNPWWGAVYHALDGSSVLLPRIALYPTPSAAATPGMNFTYVSGWATLTDDTDIARIPAFMEPLYKDVLTAVARGWEDDLDTPGRKQEYLAIVRAGGSYRGATEADRAFQQSWGKLRGGVGATHEYGRTIITLA